jgi:hypothetical protein
MATAKKSKSDSEVQTDEAPSQHISASVEHVTESIQAIAPISVDPVSEPEPENKESEAPSQQSATINDFAIAAMQSIDWNQIGMGFDQAAKTVWEMAAAMVRNKPAGK